MQYSWVGVLHKYYSFAIVVVVCFIVAEFFAVRKFGYLFVSLSNICLIDCASINAECYPSPLLVLLSLL